MSRRSMVAGCVALAGTLVVADAAPAQGPGGRPGSEAIPSIDDRTSGLKKIDGFFPLYWDEAGGRHHLLLEHLRDAR